jgi:mannan endo-1,6-alpha-mannosidase
MSALSVIASNLIDQAPDLVTNMTGGTSVGNPAAGTTNNEGNTAASTPVTTAGRAGAGILTVLILSLLVGGIGFMVFGG